MRTFLLFVLLTFVVGCTSTKVVTTNDDVYDNGVNYIQEAPAQPSPDPSVTFYFNVVPTYSVWSPYYVFEPYPYYYSYWYPYYAYPFHYDYWYPYQYPYWYHHYRYPWEYRWHGNDGWNHRGSYYGPRKTVISQPPPSNLNRKYQPKPSYQRKPIQNDQRYESKPAPIRRDYSQPRTSPPPRQAPPSRQQNYNQQRQTAPPVRTTQPTQRSTSPKPSVPAGRK